MIHASEMSVADVRSVTVARGYQVVYVDYLQIINPEHRTRQGDRFRDVTQISMDLHRMAVSLGVLVVALSQLSRPDRSARSKVPDLYSLRESGQIEQDADAVFSALSQRRSHRRCSQRLPAANAAQDAASCQE